MRSETQLLLTGAVLWLLGATPSFAQKPEGAPLPAATPEQAEFFEKRVRPILAERCYSCHGAQLQSGGLRLDSPAALLRPTAKGHSPILPGSPAQSAVIMAIRYDGPVKMPPQGKLTAKDVDALTLWVKMGAPWPVAA